MTPDGVLRAAFNTWFIFRSWLLFLLLLFNLCPIYLLVSMYNNLMILPNKKCRFYCIWIRKKILFCKGNKSLRIQSIRQQVYFARNVPRASVFKIAFLDTSKRLYYCLVKYYAPSSAHLALSARKNIPIRRLNCFIGELKKKIFSPHHLMTVESFFAYNFAQIVNLFINHEKMLSNSFYLFST